MRVVTEPNQVRLQVETHAVVTCAVLLLECWHSLKKKKVFFGSVKKKKSSSDRIVEYFISSVTPSLYAA